MDNLERPTPFVSRFRDGLLLVLMVLAVCWYLLYRLATPLQSEPLTGALHGNDFKHLYLGAAMLSQQQNPYNPQDLFRHAEMSGIDRLNPYVYLPFTGLVLSPLTLLTAPEALMAWFFINHLLFISALFLIFHGLKMELNLANISWTIIIGAFCYPFYRTLTAGQLNAVLLFLYGLILMWERRNRAWSAGIAAAFACLFKITPGILLFYFFQRGLKSPGSGFEFLGRRYGMRGFYLQAAGIMVTAIIAWMALSVFSVGWDIHQAYLPLLQNMGFGKSTWAEMGQAFYRDPSNQSWNSFFHHILVPWQGFTPLLQGGARAANILTRLMVVVMVGLVLWRCRPVRQEYETQRFERLDHGLHYSLFVLLALLIPSIYWDHYAVMALLPLSAAFAILSEGKKKGVLALTVLFLIPLNNFPLLPLMGKVLVQPELFHRLDLSPADQLGLWLGGAIFLLALLAFIVSVPDFLAPGHSAAPLLALATAGLLCRFPFAMPDFFQGVGLLAMSFKLWATLLLFGLSLVWVRQNYVPHQARSSISPESELSL